jgi:geranylgeranyl pyrophosphate synthase
MICKDNDQNNDYKKVIEIRSKKILKRFGEVAVLEVTNPKLVEALEDVKKYWKDFSRPALTSFSCEAVGGNPDMAENASLMFTLASSGFGIHDDILDKSLNKHLRMTILGLHGVNTALLVGDLLMVKAWTIMHEMNTNSHPKSAELFKEYGRFCIEVCEAEFMETLCKRNLDIDLQYYQGILWKAMGETAACCKIGAMLGGGRIGEVEALSEFGRRVGFMSRLGDDLEDCLNVKADLEHRIINESLPLPLLYAAKYSPEMYLKIKKIVGKKHFDKIDVKCLLEVCFESGAFEYLRNIAYENKIQASERIHSLEHSTAQQILQYILNKSFERIDSLCI